MACADTFQAACAQAIKSMAGLAGSLRLGAGLAQAQVEELGVAIDQTYHQAVILCKAYPGETSRIALGAMLSTVAKFKELKELAGQSKPDMRDISITIQHLARLLKSGKELLWTNTVLTMPWSPGEETPYSLPEDATANLRCQVDPPPSVNPHAHDDYDLPQDSGWHFPQREEVPGYGSVARPGAEYRLLPQRAALPSPPQGLAKPSSSNSFTATRPVASSPCVPPRPTLALPSRTRTAQATHAVLHNSSATLPGRALEQKPQPVRHVYANQPVTPWSMTSNEPRPRYQNAALPQDIILPPDGSVDYVNLRQLRAERSGQLSDP